MLRLLTRQMYSTVYGTCVHTAAPLPPRRFLDLKTTKVNISQPKLSWPRHIPGCRSVFIRTTYLWALCALAWDRSLLVQKMMKYRTLKSWDQYRLYYLIRSEQIYACRVFNTLVRLYREVTLKYKELSQP